MIVKLTATVYVWIAICIACGLQLQMQRTAFVVRAYAAWAFSAAIVFLLGYTLPAAIGIAVLLFLTAPGAPAVRAAYFILVLPAIPHGPRAPIPFPGINYLIELDHVAVCGIALLVPILLARFFSPAQMRTGNPGRMRIGSTDLILIAFIVYLTVMSSRELPLTSVIRNFWIYCMITLIPYFAISRSAQSFEDLRLMLYVFVPIALVLVSIQLVEQAQHWRIYAELAPEGSIWRHREIRHGVLRVEATLFGPLIGWIGSVATAALLAFRTRENISLTRAGGFFGLILLSAFFTGSRAAMIVPVAGGGLYLLMKIAGRYSRLAVVGAFLAAGIVGAIYLSGDTDKTDQFGTISYRRDLLETSIEQIKNYPLFGKVDYIQGENFAHLRQGQGIIDIVNYYLQIALEFGLIGLGLFVGAFVTAGYPLIRFMTGKYKLNGKDQDDALAMSIVRVLIAANLTFMFVISTTSSISYIPQFSMILIALTRAAAVLCSDSTKIVREKRQPARPMLQGPKVPWPAPGKI